MRNRMDTLRSNAEDAMDPCLKSIKTTVFRDGLPVEDYPVMQPSKCRLRPPGRGDHNAQQIILEHPITMVFWIAHFAWDEEIDENYRVYQMGHVLNVIQVLSLETFAFDKMLLVSEVKGG